MHVVFRGDAKILHPDSSTSTDSWLIEISGRKLPRNTKEDEEEEDERVKVRSLYQESKPKRAFQGRKKKVKLELTVDRDPLI